MRSRAHMQRERIAAQAARTQSRRNDKSLHCDAVIRKFEEALVAAGQSPYYAAEYSEGWYVVHTSRGRVNYREADILRKTQVLWATVHAREIEVEDK